MALQYAAHPDPNIEQQEHWGDEWTGCKLWGGCGGTRCKGEGKVWRTPARYPRKRPPGIHPERAKCDGCPLSFVHPEDWRVIRLWYVWKQLGGMPSPGSVEDQESKLVDAFAILDGEQDMITAYHHDEALRRSRSRGSRHG